MASWDFSALNMVTFQKGCSWDLMGIEWDNQPIHVSSVGLQLSSLGFMVVLCGS